jgi:hypothetical protein
MARLEAPLGATNILIKPSQKSSRNSVFIARMLVRARLRVSVRIMNVTNQDQVLSEGTTKGHGVPSVWAAAIMTRSMRHDGSRGSANNLGK